jgi:hypothetical protein
LHAIVRQLLCLTDADSMEGEADIVFAKSLNKAFADADKAWKDHCNDLEDEPNAAEFLANHFHTLDSQAAHVVERTNKLELLRSLAARAMGMSAEQIAALPKWGSRRSKKPELKSKKGKGKSKVEAKGEATAAPKQPKVKPKPAKPATAAAAETESGVLVVDSGDDADEPVEATDKKDGDGAAEPAGEVATDVASSGDSDASESETESEPEAKKPAKTKAAARQTQRKAAATETKTQPQKPKFSADVPPVEVNNLPVIMCSC